MNDETEKTASDEDEISLIDLFAVLWRRKKMIIGITIVAIIGVVLYSIISLTLPSDKSPLPNVYTPEAIMLIDNKSSSGGLSSMMGSLGGLGGLASLAGLTMSGSSSYSQLALFLIETNSFLDAVVDEFGIIERFEIEKSPRANSRKALKKLFKAELDSPSNTLSIKFTDTDPEFARDVINFSVAYLENRFNELGLDKSKIEKENLELNIANTYKEILKLEEESRSLEQAVAYGTGRYPSITIEMNRLMLELEAQKQIYTQLKVQYELNKIEIASESPIFQVLEYAEVPDQKSGPSRGMICIIVTFAAGFLSIFLAFALNAVSNIKKDPQAMAKLRGTYEK